MMKNTYAMGMVKEESIWEWADISLGELTINLNINVVYGMK
jgi:hypothetical protein